VVSGDDEMADAFNHAVDTIVTGWRIGGLAPRVEEALTPGKEPAACGYCPVAQACLRSDSGYRRRLVEWMEREAWSGSEVELAAINLWWLGVDRPNRGGA